MKIEEVWKDIKHQEGRYKVSNLGKVMSMRSGKVLVPHPNDRGYLTVGYMQNGKKKRKTIHRLVAETFIPNPNDCPQVNHIDGVKTNNCVDNLEWCNQAENMAHSTKLGIHVMGETHGRAIVTEAQVLEMRAKYAVKRTKTLEQIGKEYGIRPTHVCLILKNVIWKHLL